MRISYLTTMQFRRHTLAALTACGLIIAASQGFAVRAQAADAGPDYVAPLDLEWSIYAEFTEYPEFRPGAPAPHAFAGGTTGMGSADSKAAGASQQEAGNAAFPDDIWKHAP
jgi:hypothetical protein